jgi:hypothetical protein
VEETVLTLITRRDCPLCEEMEEVVRRVTESLPARVEVRNVDDDQDLRTAFGEHVPVLLVDGRKAFKYRLTAAQLERRLRAERRRRRLAALRRRLSPSR